MALVGNTYVTRTRLRQRSVPLSTVMGPPLQQPHGARLDWRAARGAGAALPPVSDGRNRRGCRRDGSMASRDLPITEVMEQFVAGRSETPVGESGGRREPLGRREGCARGCPGARASYDAPAYGIQCCSNCSMSLFKLSESRLAVFSADRASVVES